MGSNGRHSHEERKLEGGMSEKQSGLPPPVSASEARSSGLPPAVYIAYGNSRYISRRRMEKRLTRSIGYGLR